jgi:hypothetical protein
VTRESSVFHFAGVLAKFLQRDDEMTGMAGKFGRVFYISVITALRKIIYGRGVRGK